MRAFAQPFGYWNAVGLMAALGVPPLLWLAARRSGNQPRNALAWPALGLLFTALMLSYSRGALLALLVGLAFWFAVVPLAPARRARRCSSPAPRRLPRSSRGRSRATLSRQNGSRWPPGPTPATTLARSSC